jgi:hypothetical protein
MFPGFGGAVTFAACALWAVAKAAVAIAANRTIRRRVSDLPSAGSLQKSHMLALPAQ